MVYANIGEFENRKGFQGVGGGAAADREPRPVLAHAARLAQLPDPLFDKVGDGNGRFEALQRHQSGPRVRGRVGETRGHFFEGKLRATSTAASRPSTIVIKLS